MQLDLLCKLTKMQLDLLCKLTKIVLEIERSQQELLYLRDYRQNHSQRELSVVNGALEELDKCRLTLDDFRNKIIRNKIRVGEDATDK